MKGRLNTLVNKLHDKTNNREISWEAGDADDEFVASFSTYSILLSKYLGQYNNESVIITVLNDEGKTLETITSEDVINESILGSLYEEARRIALGTDEAIDELINLLD